MRRIASTVMGLATCLALCGAAAAPEYNPVRMHPQVPTAGVQRVIVKMRATANAERVQALASRAGMTLKSERALTARLYALRLAPSAGESETQTLDKLRADPDVEYAVPDRRMYPHAVPNDPLGPAGGGQWYLQAAQPSGINATGAWDITLGSDSVVIAVIDTGVRFDHPDLGRAGTGGGRLLAGYDFVSPDSANDFSTANDGDGRDADASDPGDWVTAADGCGAAGDSSWHGTRTSGIIGAIADNAIGISGVTWRSRILPVRVLGKCGGYNSDVLEGMLWATGQDVSGVAHNGNPAQIVNVSLGGAGACDAATADVLQQLTTLGVLIVVSAGNEGGPVDSPANCPGAMGIAGLRHAGTKVGYSSLGPEIALAAPAGNCVNNTVGSPCLYSIDTTVNLGTTTPGTNSYTDQFNSNLGTSFSAPIVSGIAGLMLAVNGNLKAAHLTARLKEGASPFPTSSENANIPTCHTPQGSADVQATECVCTTNVCGAGMANALGAVNAALRPIANIVVQGAVSAGAALTLQGGGSTAADGHSIASYSWIKAGGVIGSTQSVMTTAPASGNSTVCLTVTDDAGKQDTALVQITQSAATVSLVAAGANPCSFSEITVTATDASASESGDTGTFTFTRSRDATAALSVGIATSGTGTSGADYQNPGTTITFAAGAATATLALVPIDDAIVDGPRTAIVTIQGGAGYVVGSPASATVTIADNDTSSSSSGSSGGGGGGGAFDAATLAGLAFVWLCVTHRARLKSASGKTPGPFAATLPVVVTVDERARDYLQN